MTTSPTRTSIQSDIPLSDPTTDDFGYAPFAKHIADAVVRMHAPQGAVLAIDGPWGSGKTSLVNFVKHYLVALPQEARPQIIDFNPWWFDDRKHLASQFLAQFMAKLPHESEALRKVGDLMAEYGNAIGGVVATSIPVPFVDKVIGFVLGLFKRKTKDVPKLKAEIAAALSKAGKRFLFVVDDLDRLAPEEICEVFKVIKALADFPNVVYLLAFDRGVVAASLSIALHTDGDAYLEKIVQAPFVLPSVNKLRLRNKLFKSLDLVLGSSTEQNFDQTYWANVYFDGLDHYITKPRDVIRIANTLAVTFPGVVGEVNVVDFVALEFLRVFEPAVYNEIRNNGHRFVGHSNDRHENQRKVEFAYHDGWLSRVPQEQRPAVKDMMQRIFPRLEGVWGNMGYAAEFAGRWRRELRVCSPDTFEVYFEFGVPTDSLSRKELSELIASASNLERCKELLLASARVRRPSGASKAREYLERLTDLEDEISAEVAEGLLIALADVADVLLSPSDESGGMGSVPNRWRLLWAFNHLLKRVLQLAHKDLIKRLVSTGQAYCTLTEIIDTMEDGLQKKEGRRESPFSEMGEEYVTELKTTMIDRLGRLTPQQLLAIPELDFVFHKWQKWSSDDVVAPKAKQLIDDIESLPIILEKHLRWGTVQGFSDRVAKRIPKVSPKSFEWFVDIHVLEKSVREMLLRSDLSSDQRSAGQAYVKSMDRIRNGKDPDGFLRDEDE